jgi:cobalt-precorrin-5B (C1)-methyltransferase
MLLTGAASQTVTLATPSGAVLTLDVLDGAIARSVASCAVQKDGGDDPDVTNGCLVYAHVSLRPEGVEISGGEGIGRVTKPGLDRPVGAHAINSVPLRHIREECEAVCREHGYEGGLSVVISIPGGEKIAKRTFNPRMGIKGGLSVLGTTGIVEPMSEAAVAETLRAELSLLYEAGHREVVLTVGNHAESFARNVLRLGPEPRVKCANFIGEILSAAAEKGFARVLLIGHIGKLVKLGIGITNTHSGHGDGRMETLIACALEAGAPIETLRSIRDCVSTDAALDCLTEAELFDKTIAVLRERISDTLESRVAGTLRVNVVCFCGMGETMREVFSI